MSHADDIPETDFGRSSVVWPQIRLPYWLPDAPDCCFPRPSSLESHHNLADLALSKETCPFSS